MAAGTGRSADLAVKDSISERHHRLGGARRNGKRCNRVGAASIGMRAFRWLGVVGTDLAGGCRCAGAGRDACRIGRSARSAAVDDTIDPSAYIIGHVEGAVGPDRDAAPANPSANISQRPAA